MDYIQGTPREQSLLFPEVIDDYITGDNPVRFIDAFVDSLDLEDLGFQRSQPALTGRPPYDPGDLLKLYIYGYLNRIRSSRRLEKEASRNVELMWLLRKLTPDFKTIADFRKDNHKAFMGYYHGHEIKTCEEEGIEPYVSKPLTSANRKLGLYGKEKFAYDPDKDRYLCPGGQELLYRFETTELGRRIRYYTTTACRNCKIKEQCTRNKAGRRITRWVHEHILERMQERVPMLMSMNP